MIIKLLLFTTVIFGSGFSASSQDSSAREQLLQSKRNLKVSRLFSEAPVLPIDDPEIEIYRITFIPTFFNPIKIRVERRNASYLLVAKRLSGQGGYDAGPLKTEKRRKLRQKEWQHLISLLDTAGFWTMPYADKKPEPNERGEVEICLDGSEWMLEGVKNGRFHAVNRYCPEVKSFKAIGAYLAKLSGLKIKERELY
ncbi:MAG: hypothetical protein AB7Q37_01940 [Pyrinomonadaceae bacterium]